MKYDNKEVEQRIGEWKNSEELYKHIWGEV